MVENQKTRFYPLKRIQTAGFKGNIDVSGAIRDG
jgi:hypothetical protein